MRRIRTIDVELPPAFFGDAHRLAPSESLLCDLLEVMVRANMLHLHVEPRTPSIYRAGVRWHETEGARLSSIPAVRARGRAACASLSCWRTAELRTGGDLAARPELQKRTTGARSVLYHVVVRRGDGRVEDPSRRLGMRGAG